MQCMESNSKWIDGQKDGPTDRQVANKPNFREPVFTVASDFCSWLTGKGLVRHETLFSLPRL